VVLAPITTGYQCVEIYFVLGSVAGLSSGGSPTSCVLAFCVVSWTSLVIHGLPADPFISTMCRSIGHSLLLNEIQAYSLL
jgi:hypothetical protein